MNECMYVCRNVYIYINIYIYMYIYIYVFFYLSTHVYISPFRMRHVDFRRPDNTLVFGHHRQAFQQKHLGIFPLATIKTYSHLGVDRT